MAARTVRGALLLILTMPALAFAQAIPTQTPPLGPAIPFSHVPATNLKPVIISGDPATPTFPTPLNNIDFNFPDSPLAGVVSVYAAANSSNGAFGSGVVIGSQYILTAAHVVDFAGGLDPSNNQTGDGIVDALIPNSRIYLNNIAAPNPLAIDSITIMPGWHGFNNINSPTGPSSHNDLAIIKLHDPLPASVPIYPIYRTPFATDTAKIILMSGYGGGGDAIQGLTQPATLEVKHFGFNYTGVYEPGETAATANTAEVFLADFDKSDTLGMPTFDHVGFDSATSVGNGFESIISPGDSGGPSFLFDDLNNDNNIEVNELTVFGLNTFTFDTSDGDWPHYGAGFGGTILSAYLPFVDGVTGLPEPSSLALLSLALPILLRRRRQSAINTAIYS